MHTCTLGVTIRNKCGLGVLVNVIPECEKCGLGVSKNYKHIIRE